LISHIEGGRWAKVLENRVLKKISAPEREEVRGT
jgi:hypothetical protein